MILILASTGGVITGAEVAAAGGTAVVGQKLLEAVFGEDAVRRMAKQARLQLHEHALSLLAWYLAPFDDLLDSLPVKANVKREIDVAIAEVRTAQEELA